MLPLEITCTCHRVKIAMRCQTPLVSQIALIICMWRRTMCWILIFNQICFITTPSRQSWKFLRAANEIKTEKFFVELFLLVCAQLGILWTFQCFEFIFLLLHILCTCQVAVNTWFWSTVFHMRDFEFTQVSVIDVYSSFWVRWDNYAGILQQSERG